MLPKYILKSVKDQKLETRKIPYTKADVEGKYYARPMRDKSIIYEQYKDKDGKFGGRKVGTIQGVGNGFDVAKYLNDWFDMPAYSVWRVNEKSKFIKDWDFKPWEHFIVMDGKVIKFIWDTREVTGVYKLADESDMRANFSPVTDNKKPLAKNGKWLHRTEIEEL